MVRAMSQSAVLDVALTRMQRQCLCRYEVEKQGRSTLYVSAMRESGVVSVVSSLSLS